MPTFCDKCGNKLKNENAKFCDKCGAEIKTNQNKNNSETVSGVICPQCGKTTPMGETTCPNCGGDVQIENNTTAVVVGYIGIWILPIISLIMGIYLLTRRSGKSKTQGIFLIIFMILYLLVSSMIGDYVYTLNEIIYKYLLIPIIATIIGAITWSKNFTLL